VGHFQPVVVVLEQTQARRLFDFSWFGFAAGDVLAKFKDVTTILTECRQTLHVDVFYIDSCIAIGAF
jgi:hypothetical protein